MPSKNRYQQFIEEAEREISAKAAAAAAAASGAAKGFLNGATYDNGGAAAGALNVPASYYGGSIDIPSQLMEIGRKNFKREHKDFYTKYPQTNAVSEALGSMFGGAAVATPVTKGAMLAGKGVLKGVDFLRMVLEARKIRKAYNAVKANPFKGNAQDILIKIRPIGQDPFLIKKGAITGTAENPIVSGLRLAEYTGVYNNFGLTKGIWGHNLKADNYTILPKVLRKLKPFEVMGTRQRWRYPTGTGRNYMTVFGKDNQGQKSLLTHFIENEGAAGKMSPKR
jgi:hypothetical protein